MKTYLLYSIFFVSAFAFSQTKVTGTVVNITDNPIAGVAVVFKGTDKGIETDEEGKFVLNSDERERKLEVSFLGFKKETIKLKKGDNLDLKIILKQEGVALDEVTLENKKKRKELLLGRWNMLFNTHNVHVNKYGDDCYDVTYEFTEENFKVETCDGVIDRGGYRVINDLTINADNEGVYLGNFGVRHSRRRIISVSKDELVLEEVYEGIKDVFNFTREEI